MAFKAKSVLYNVVFHKLRVPRLDDDGNPQKDKKGQTKLMAAKFEFPVKVPVGTHADYEAYWKKEGLNPATTLDGLLNQMEKQSKEGYKAEVRSAVVAVEAKIYKPQLTLTQLTKACREDEDVQRALEEMQAAVTANHIGSTRTDGITKTKAAAVGVELLKKDPDTLKQIAATLGISI